MGLEINRYGQFTHSGTAGNGSPLLAKGGEDTKKIEYLLVIYPGGEMLDKLIEEQQRFAEGYGLPGSRINRPHITMAAFQAAEGMEAILIRWIQRICNYQERFEIILNNYSGFPPHTIYLRVQDPHPFHQFTGHLQAIDEFFRSSGCPPAKLATRPYLSIAGGLTEKVYNKAMPEYSRRTFHESFRVDSLLLLKRDHSFDACRTVNVFPLPASLASG